MVWRHRDRDLPPNNTQQLLMSLLPLLFKLKFGELLHVISKKFSSQRKKNKIFSTAKHFRFVLTCPHWPVFVRKCILFDTFWPLVHIKTSENADGNDSTWLFSSLHTRNGPFLKWFVFTRLHLWNRFESVFARFRVDDRRKRIKNYAFWHENEWSEPQIYIKQAFCLVDCIPQRNSL